MVYVVGLGMIVVFGWTRRGLCSWLRHDSCLGLDPSWFNIVLFGLHC